MFHCHAAPNNAISMTLARILHRLSTLPGFALIVLLLSAGSAGAESLVLKRDAELSDAAVAGPEGPLFLMADRIESSAPGIVEASGRGEARQADQNFFADWLPYDTTPNEVEGGGK